MESQLPSALAPGTQRLPLLASRPGEVGGKQGTVGTGVPFVSRWPHDLSSFTGLDGPEYRCCPLGCVGDVEADLRPVGATMSLFVVFFTVGFTCAFVLTLSVCLAAKHGDAVEAPPLLDRTEGMCEYGDCRDRWTVLLDLGPKGSRFVCDHHVDLVVRENIEPEFEAMGVVA